MSIQRKYRLNLRNYGNMPAIMVPQYDAGYNLVFEIYDGASPASNLSAYTVTLKGTRSDGLGFTFAGTVASNVLSFLIDNSMTAVSGRGSAEVVITDNNDLIFASFNLPVFVEKAVHPDSTVDADTVQQQTLLEQIQAAASSVTDMTVSSTTLAAGSEATVTKTTVDDVINLEFGLPQGATGATGATPNFTIGTVTTLDPDDDATATITGTAANPVLNLGIPKGDTGEVSQAEFDEVAGDVSQLKSELTGTISKNLIGTEAGVLYPCFIPKGTPFVNVSTSDGSTFRPPVGSVLKLLVHNINGQAIDTGWVLGDTRTYLDCNFAAYYSNIDIYYVSLNVPNAVPLMVTTQKAKVNGSVPYEAYFPSTKAIAERVDVINAEINGSVPYYYQSHMESKASTLLALDNVDTQVGFITDEHYPMNAKNSPDLMRYLWDNVPMDFVVNNGDVLVQEMTKAGAMQAITKFNALYDFCGDNYFPVIGNHEHNNANGQSASTQLSLAQVQLSTYSKIRNVKFSGYTAYYFDDDVAKCRFFFIGTMQNSQLYEADVAWVLDAFKSVPSGYNIIVFSHAGLKYDSSYAVTGVQVGVSSIAMGLLAVANKSSYTYNHVLYDYSAVNAVPVAIFSGHVHFDGSYQYTNANYNGYIYIIATTCDAYGTQPIGSVDRTAGTVNEQAFDVISVDCSNRLITMTRIGAGANRTFTYSDYVA